MLDTQFFEQFYDPKHDDTLYIYIYIQFVQTKLFRTLIEKGKCATNIPFVKITIDDKDVSADADDIANLRDVLDTSSKQIVVCALIYSTIGEGGHYGLMVFNQVNRTMTLFDPSSAALAQKGIMGDIYDVLETGYRRKDLSCFSSLQHLTGDYYCAMWSMLVAYYLCTTDNTIGEIVSDISKLTLHQMNRTIKGFIKYAYIEADRLGITKEATQVVDFTSRIIMGTYVPLDMLVSDKQAVSILSTIKYKPDPLKYIESINYLKIPREIKNTCLDNVILELARAQIVGLQGEIDNTNDIDTLKRISSFMCLLMKQEIPKVSMDEEFLLIETTKIGSNYMPREINNALSGLMQGVIEFFPLMRNASKHYTSSPQDFRKSMAELKTAVKEAYRLKYDSAFIFVYRYLLRYLIIDTEFFSIEAIDPEKKISISMDVIMLYRELEYTKSLSGINPSDRKPIVNAILYPVPMKINTRKYLQYISLNYKTRKSSIKSLIEDALVHADMGKENEAILRKKIRLSL